MIKLNKFFAVVFINLMLISAFCSCGSVNALDYVQVETVYTDAGDMLSRFSVWALSGEISADGTSFGVSCTPALTHYSEYEYYTFVFYAKDNPVVEIAVPDTYMGIDVELWDGSAYVLRTGNASFTLSVPYNFNSSSVPLADWGTMPLAQPYGSVGSLRRVQLAANTTALSEAGTAQLRIKIYYATAPSVGFDGVDDTVGFSAMNHTSLNVKFDIKIIHYDVWDIIASCGSWGVEDPFLIGLGANGNIYSNFKTTGGPSGAYSGVIASSFSRYNITAFCDGTTGYLFYINETLKASKLTDGDVIALGTSSYYIARDNNGRPSTILYSNIITDNATTTYLSLNASSFSGGSNTTVTDFSAAGNHGTAYGGVQYKVNLINGYQLTYIALVASINVNETVINWYGEMEVLAALVVVLAFFIITLFAYYKMQNSTMVLLSAVFALMVNVLSLSSGIPFSPFPQLFLSIVELMLLVYARRMNI